MHPRRHLTGAMLAVGLLSAVAACSSSPGTITVHGTEIVFANPLNGENVQTAYPDITTGSQVTVVNSTGKVIGTGTLRYNATATARDLSKATAGISGLSGSDFTSFVAEYDFTVTVPAGLARYGISSGHDRGTIWFSGAQMRKGPSLSLGSLTG